MSGIGGKWVVQRYEQTYYEALGDRPSLSRIGRPKVCDSWREACEAVTLAIGDNCLKLGVTPDEPVVFERDGVVVVVYMKLVC